MSWPSSATTRGHARFFTEEGPVDDLDLIVTLGRLCVALAMEIGAREDPPIDAGTVLARLALEWGGHS